MALLRRSEGIMYWVSANEADLNCIIFHYQTAPTQGQIDADYNAYVTLHQYDVFPKITIDPNNQRYLIIDIVKKIKATPTITLTQYNTYLATKLWYEAAFIRYFVSVLAFGLSQYYGVTLTDLTETQVLLQVRNWIVATPAAKISKIFLDTLTDI